MRLTIDPGDVTGWAKWRATRGGELIDCGLWYTAGGGVHTSDPHEVWIESPTIYPRSPVPPADVVTLARTAGEWGGRFLASGVPRERLHYVEPRTWKGQVPKEIHHARMWAQLSPIEQGIVDRACRGVAPSARHNVLDAVALGLWVRKQGR